MTRQEAIDSLVALDAMHNGEYSKVFARAIKALVDIEDCNNELCLKCGNYKGAHLGLCNGCRWELKDERP